MGAAAVFCGIIHGGVFNLSESFGSTYQIAIDSGFLIFELARLQCRTLHERI